MTLQSIAGPDPDSDAEYTRASAGPDYLATRHHPAAPGDGAELHVGARPELRPRQAHRLQRHAHRRAAPLKIAYDALVAAGAIMVLAAARSTVGSHARRCPAATRQHKTIDEYYKRLGPHAPIKSLVEEVADNQANAHEALKFGNGNHLNASLRRHHARRRPTRSRTGRTCRSARPPGTRRSTT